MKKRYSQETVVKALTLYQDGKPLKEIAREIGLAPGNNGVTLISQWRRRAGLKSRQPVKNWDQIKEQLR